MAKTARPYSKTSRDAKKGGHGTYKSKRHPKGKFAKQRKK